ncbi:hypothetical protein ACM55H_01030 [Flavobacterium sp. ZT3R17]|uniref:hypothetical protein n=1 Tax=Flavobacterium cryoconiti TaxID=3398736 RepID=UPI003A87C77F
MKQEKQVIKTVNPNASGDDLNHMLKILGFKTDCEEKMLFVLRMEQYNKKAGVADYKNRRASNGTCISFDFIICIKTSRSS